MALPHLRLALALAVAALTAACLESQPPSKPAQPADPPAAEPALVLYWTVGMEGFVDLCGCSPDMPGGWARLALIREEEPDAVWVDAGGWAYGAAKNDPVPEVTARLFQEGFMRVGYTAVHVAPADRAAWETLGPRRQTLWLAGGGLDYEAGEPTEPGAGPPHREVALDVAWLDTSPRLAVLAVGEAGHLPALRERLARVGETHGVILLSALEPAENRALLEADPNIAYLIGPGPEERGELAARWSPPLEPFGWEVGRVELPSGNATRTITDGPMDGATGMWIAQLREEGFAERVPLDTGLSPASQACAACHSAEYAVWERSGHAKAWATLVGRQFEERPDCVGCHTVGWDYEALTYDAVDVGCLACHSGDGPAHIANPVAAPLGLGSQEVCASCHRPDHSTMWSLRGYWPRVAHGREGPL